jgi:hypothetical protein
VEKLKNHRKCSFNGELQIESSFIRSVSNKSSRETQKLGEKTEQKAPKVKNSK